MFITCDSSCNMGYIYLMLDNYNIVEKNKKYIDKLKEKIGVQNFNIEILEDRDKKIENKLNSLKISSKTYKKLIKNSVFTDITIKSLISSRQDLYPLEYLKKPLFLIW